MTQTITITIDRQYKPWLITPAYAYKDDSRPVLSTIQLHPNGYMVAADGFCLMMAPIEIDEPGLAAPVLVPAELYQAVHKFWSKDYRTLPCMVLNVLTPDDGETGITQIKAKTSATGETLVGAAEGQFPDYWRIIPSEYGELAKATFDPVKLTRLYEALVGDKKEPIVMAIYQGIDTGPGLVAPGDGGIGVIMPMTVVGGTSMSRDYLTRRLDHFRLTPAERKAKQEAKEQAEEAKEAAEEAEMIELLGETGTIKINELQIKHGAGYGNMTAVLARLREQGRIVQEGDRSWEKTVRLNGADDPKYGAPAAETWIAEHPEIAAANEQTVADLTLPAYHVPVDAEEPVGGPSHNTLDLVDRDAEGAGYCESTASPHLQSDRCVGFKLIRKLEGNSNSMPTREENAERMAVEGDDANDPDDEPWEDDADAPPYGTCDLDQQLHQDVGQCVNWKAADFSTVPGPGVYMGDDDEEVLSLSITEE